MTDQQLKLAVMILSRSGFFSEAFNVGLQIQNPRTQHGVLRSVVEMAMAEGRFNEALVIAHNVPHENTRALLYSRIAINLAAAHRLAAALEVTRDIPEHLTGEAEEEQGTDEPEESPRPPFGARRDVPIPRRIPSTVPTDFLRSETLLQIAHDLLQREENPAHLWQVIMGMAREKVFADQPLQSLQQIAAKLNPGDSALATLPNDQLRAMLLMREAATCIAQGETERALVLAHEIPDTAPFNWMWLNALYAIADKVLNLHPLTEISHVVTAFANTQLRAIVLQRAAAVWIERAAYSEALGLVHLIRDAKIRTALLQEIIAAYTAAGRYQEVAALLGEVSEAGVRTRLGMQVFNALYQRGELDRALQVTLELSGDPEKSEALKQVFDRLTEDESSLAAKLDQALAVARAIPNADIRTESLYKIALYLIGQQRIDTALQLAGDIHDDNHRTTLLRKSVEVYLAEGDVARALEITEMIPFERVQAEKMLQIAAALVNDTHLKKVLGRQKNKDTAPIRLLQQVATILTKLDRLIVTEENPEPAASGSKKLMITERRLPLFGSRREGGSPFSRPAGNPPAPVPRFGAFGRREENAPPPRPLFGARPAAPAAPPPARPNPFGARPAAPPEPPRNPFRRDPAPPPEPRPNPFAARPGGLLNAIRQNPRPAPEPEEDNEDVFPGGMTPEQRRLRLEGIRRRAEADAPALPSARRRRLDELYRRVQSENVGGGDPIPFNEAVRVFAADEVPALVDVPPRPEPPIDLGRALEVAQRVMGDAARDPEALQFTAYYPAEVQIENTTPCLAYFFRANAAIQVAESAKEMLELYKNSGGAEPQIEAASPEKVAIDMRLTFPGIEVLPVRHTVFFDDEWDGVEFFLRVPKGMAQGLTTGTFTYAVRDVLLGELAATVNITDKAVAHKYYRVQGRRFARIFPCFNAANHSDLLRMQEAAEILDDEFLRQAVTWRRKESDEKKLLGLIEQADAFQLHWSAYIAVHPPLQKEWRLARKLVAKGQKPPQFFQIITVAADAPPLPADLLPYATRLPD